MLKFILKRIVQGGLTMVGVVLAVFFLFYVLPGDPTRMVMQPGHGDDATYRAIRAELGLDQPLSIQFLTYINDLSPISIHKVSDKDSPFFLDPDKYSPYIELYSFGGPTHKDQE